VRAERLALGFVAAVAIAAGGARAADPAPVVLCDFEKGEPTDGWTIHGPRVSPTATPYGRGLRLTWGGGEPYGSISRSFEQRDWRMFRAISMRLCVGGDMPVQLDVSLTRTDSTASLVRRFEAQPGDWREVVLPLSDFRDDGYDQAGSFARVDCFTLHTSRVTSRAVESSVSIDDLALLPGDRGRASSSRPSPQLLQLAFGSSKVRTLESEHFLLIDDAPELRTADAKRLLARLEEGLKTLGERYGVTGDLDEKVPLLLFATRFEYQLSVPRLREHFGEKPKKPKTDGFSRYGMSMAWFDEKQGWDRAVYVHETMYGVIQRRLGVLANGNWVQEGLASAVAAHLYPASIDRKKLAESFAKRGGGLVPWLDAIDWPVAPPATHLQLLTIMDFLAERRRDGLPKAWDAVRAVREPLYKSAPYEIAKALGTDVATLEKEWFAWGAKYYGGK